MDKQALKKEIEIESRNLERLVKEMREVTNRFADKPDFIETRAAGSILHDFYSGVEKIFERISVHIDGGLPKGEDWHTELLLQMARSVEGIRDAVISTDLLEKFKEYLRFRHLFRHIYGFELKWERFKDLSLSLFTILSEFKDNLKELMDCLK
ncbi:hypothetical protein ES703_78406 [subsurface metagenome]